MDPVLLRLALVVAVVLTTATIGRVVLARRDRVTIVTPDPLAGTGAATTAADHAGPDAVLFGSPTCAPCETLKQLLREVEDRRPGFTWRYVDASRHLDLAREHGVRRVPTLLVRDAAGRVVGRTGGVPPIGELLTSVDRATGHAEDDVVAGHAVVEVRSA